MKKARYKVTAVALVIAGLISVTMYAATPKKSAAPGLDPRLCCIRAEVLGSLQRRFGAVRSCI